MSETQEIQVNSIVEGKVVKIKPFGAIVKISDNHQGIVHISHISNKYVQNISDYLDVGDVINVKVLTVDATGRISLSMKDMEQPNLRTPPPPSFDSPKASGELSFEERFKEWQKISNERQAGLNKRNKRR